MGIIKRQGIKTTLVNFIGAFIGGLAVLFVYSLDNEIYGYAQWLYSTAYLILPFATLGILSLIVKYYPAYNSEGTKNYNGFLSLIILLLVAVFSLFLICWSVFKPFLVSLLDRLNMNGALLETNQHFIIILVGILILLYFAVYQASNKLRIFVPAIIWQLGYKIFLPLLVLAYVYYGFTQSQFAYAIILFYGVATLLLFLYLIAIKGLKFGKIKKPTPDFSFKEMGKYSLFGSLNQLSSGFAFRLDAIMIPLFIDMTNNGFYGKTLFIANVVEMPTRAITQIAGPIISKAWKEDDLEEIDKVYKKASNNLFLIGVFLFLVIWYVLDDLIGISADPTSFPKARMIFLFLAGAKLIDMLTSVNTQIIIYSKKYKYNLAFLVLLGISNVILNIKLIPEYQILGAAIATGISLAAYNLIKIIFIYKSYKLQPFTPQNLKSLVLLVTLALLFYVLPFDFNPIVNIILKVALLSLLFVPIAYFWNISEDVNQTVKSFFQKFSR